MSHIFISYSKRNQDYAYQLAEFLQEKGFDIWIDLIGIEYGVDWWDAILEGLRDCAAFVIIMTPEAAESRWVKRERAIAEKHNIPAFPLLRDGENWDFYITTHYVDVSDGSLPDDDFLTRLSQHVPPQPVAGMNKSNLIPEKYKGTTRPPDPPHFNIIDEIAAFYGAYRDKEWLKAQEILGRIRASSVDPHPFNPDEFEPQVQAAIEVEKRQREAQAHLNQLDQRYQEIAIIARNVDRATAWKSLITFWHNHELYDPQKLFPNLSKVKDILPDPFDWLRIPAGEVMLTGEEHPLKIHEFYMAKFPVTVEQFKVFMQDGGYKTQTYWTEIGWAWRQSENITAPRFMDQKDYVAFFQPDHPIIGVSWYEAVAYCRWLTEKTGEHIQLPSEQQWQRAAEGNDHFPYPWGNRFEEDKCNTGKSGIGHTTSVSLYYHGASPFGVMDMCGNVWEWSLTEYESHDSSDLDNPNSRAMRGGSWWSSKPDSLKVTNRGRSSPEKCSAICGFRICVV